MCHFLVHAVFLCCVCVWVCTAVLPSLSAEIFQTFRYMFYNFWSYISCIAPLTKFLGWCSCTNVDEDNVAEGDDYYLRADYSVSCETTRYSVAVVVASAAVVLYPGMCGLWSVTTSLLTSCVLSFSQSQQWEYPLSTSTTCTPIDT